MTSLNKPVLRKVQVTSQLLRSGNVVLVLHPKGFIGVRELGRRAQYKVSLQTVISNAVSITSMKIAARTRELKAQGVRRGAANKQARQECLANLEK